MRRLAQQLQALTARVFSAVAAARLLPLEGGILQQQQWQQPPLAVTTRLGTTL